jgi:hypothetical protein
MDRWVFCTGPYTHATANDGAALDAAAVTHAKVMGNPMTACGHDASSWPKLFAEAFDRSERPRCPECVEALRRGGPTHWNVSSSSLPLSTRRPITRPAPRAVDGPGMDLRVEPGRSDWGWTLTASNSRVVASSPRRWHLPGDALAAARRFCERARDASIEVTTERDGRMGWRLLLDHDVLAISAPATYATARSATRGAQRVRARAARSILRTDGTGSGVSRPWPAAESMLST